MWEAVVDNVERARARAEAMQSTERMSSADRARFCAGLNRYLRTELRRERDHAAADEAPADEAAAGRDEAEQSPPRERPEP
jgi:hypothetical protein